MGFSQPWLAHQVTFGICTLTLLMQLQSCACFVWATVNSTSMVTATGWPSMLKCSPN